MNTRPLIVKALEDMEQSADALYRLAMSFLHVGNDHVSSILIREHNTIHDNCEKILEIIDKVNHEAFKQTMEQTGEVLNALLGKIDKDNLHTEINM